MTMEKEEMVKSINGLGDKDMTEDDKAMFLREKEIELATDFTYQRFHCPFCGEKMYMFKHKDKPIFVSGTGGTMFYYCVKCNELFIANNTFFSLKKIYDKESWGFALNKGDKNKE